MPRVMYSLIHANNIYIYILYVSTYTSIYIYTYMYTRMHICVCIYIYVYTVHVLLIGTAAMVELASQAKDPTNHDFWNPPHVGPSNRMWHPHFTWSVRATTIQTRCYGLLFGSLT